MNKRFVIGSVLFLVLTFTFLLVRDNRLLNEEGLRSPSFFGSYRNYGYYKFNPEKILVSLDAGDTEVFQPLLTDPNDAEEISGDIPVSWAQADFMKVFSALSKSVWDDPMDPKEWSIYDISFSGSCFDEVCELYSAKIVLFKTTEDAYIMRIMDIAPYFGLESQDDGGSYTQSLDMQPYFGLVRWGDGASYPKPVIHKWKGVELTTSKISAEGALQIAEFNGGKEKRLKATDVCHISMGSSRFNPENWHIWCVGGYTSYITLDTGKVIDFNW